MKTGIFSLLLIAISALTFPSFAAVAGDTIHHKMDIKLEPSAHTIEAVDTITIPAALRDQVKELKVNTDLTVESLTTGITFELVEENVRGTDVGIDRDDANGGPKVAVDVYRVKSDVEGDLTFKLRITGIINNPVENVAEEYARSFSQSSGLIDEQGIYLAGATYWVPFADDTYLTYEIAVDLPKGWSSVSQGARTHNETKGSRHHDTWLVNTPTEEIYLIGAQFSEYSEQVGGVSAMAFLRSDDEALAERYLTTTAQYLEMYRELVGPYPYSKFALVENFWETGYGMPSFTLLGPLIIRFPFILHSSYPHELLHNWWGNGVFVEFEEGNWCEGLTAYMADHLVAEQRGTGSDYRRSTLQRYTDYVTPENDFPLTEFRSRYNGPTEAVGYGKSLMLWNMLREEVGDENYIRSFQHFYRENKYQRASYDDIRNSFETVSEVDLKDFFKQWVDRKGAPEFRLEETATSKDGKTIALTIRQIQKGKAYKLDLPVALYTKDDVVKTKVRLTKKKQTVELPIEEEVVRVALDPEFDVFRRLHFAEIPPSLSKVFGADKVLIVLPTSGSEQELNRYQSLADIWARDKNKVTVTKDTDLKTLPADSAVWVLGEKNKFADDIRTELQKYPVSFNGDTIQIGPETADLKSESALLVVRHPENPNSAVALLTAHADNAVPGLASKLPHYGKYSYLSFTGSEPTNVLKGQWGAVGSPMEAKLSDVISNASLTPRPALAELAPVFSADRLEKHTKLLSAPEMEGRGVGTKGLNKAANYIADVFKEYGLEPAGDDGTWFQNFTLPGGPSAPGGSIESLKNVIGVIPGKKAEMSGESVIVSAHYDHLGFGWPGVRSGDEGKIHPGADDNASGVAVMLEIAKLLSKSNPDRSIVFIATTAEEMGLRGARYYAKAKNNRYPVDKAIANINLDTVGRLEDGKVMIFGGNSATEWRFIFMGATAVTGIETQMVAQEINASDHTAFLEVGVPAIHIFGSKASDYHRPTDTSDKIDIDGMIKVAAVAKEAVVYMAERPEPLTSTLKSGTQPSSIPARPSSGRKVSTGSTPDFAFSGSGIRLSEVGEGSPAATAGLIEGDVLTSLDGKSVGDLRAYTNVLGTLEPGQTIEVIYSRDGKEQTTQMTLGKR